MDPERVCLITGASRGIGRATALALHRSGWRLSLAARSEGALAELVRETGGGHLAAVCDVTAEADVARVVAATVERFGRLDALVCAAGVGAFAPTAQSTLADWDAQIAVNLTGTYLACREALKGMLPRRSGHLVTILSVASRVAFPASAAYCASKWGAYGLTKVLAEEVRREGIRVTAVLPGSTDTPSGTPSAACAARTCSPPPASPTPSATPWNPRPTRRWTRYRSCPRRASCSPVYLSAAHRRRAGPRQPHSRQRQGSRFRDRCAYRGGQAGESTTCYRGVKLGHTRETARFFTRSRLRYNGCVIQPFVPIFAASAPLPFLSEIVAFLAAAALIAFVCQRLGLVPIVGFLLAGVVIGPNALGLVRDRELIDAAAEIGIILLLFTIGIEFSLDRLARIKKLIFAGGGLQVGLTVALATGLLLPFGVPWRVGVFTGCLIALSSTAIVLKLLGDRGEANAPAGQMSLGILIFQDLAIIVMVLLVPMLAGQGGGGGDIAWALGKAAAIIALVLLFARRIMPRVLEVVARTCSPELFLLTVIAICFGTAWLTSLAGVSLSLGAFLAGLVVSESRFSHHAFGEILPLQILFSAAFFVSVGMLLDVGFLLRNPLLVLLGIGVVLLLKVVTTGVSVLLLGGGPRVAAYSGLLLAQVGEFSFVLERAGREAGLYPAGMAETGAQSFIAATVMLMVLTPFLANAGAKLEGWMARGETAGQKKAAEAQPPERSFAHLENHVIVAGYGSSARHLVRVLRDAGIPYVILTLSPGGANEAEGEGQPVLRGDYSRQHLLSLAGIERARMLVVADDDHERARHVAAVARVANPTLSILVRTRFVAEVEPLRQAGADLVVPEELESAIQIFSRVLEGYQVPPGEIDGHVQNLRADDYSTLREEPAPPAAESPPAATLTPQQRASTRCTHLGQVRDVTPGAPGCEECLALGDTWVHLRVCMSCGHVGCCDTSKNKHATQHFHATDHPIVRSFEPGEDWAWCYVDKTLL